MPLFGLSLKDVEKMEAKRDLKGLIKALEYEKDDSIRRRATEALVKIGGENTVEKLVIALKNQNMHGRMEAADALGMIRDARAVDGLIVALKDQERNVRARAAQALGKIGDARAVDGLIVALKDQQKYVHLEAEAALHKITGRFTFEELVVALKNPNWQIRELAAKALGETRDARAVDGLVVALKDQNEDLRRTAAVALGKIEGARAHALLGLYTELFNADNLSRVTAAQAICALEPDEAGLANLSRSLIENDETVNAHVRKAISKIQHFGPAAKEAVPQLLVAWQKAPMSLDTFFIETLGKMGAPQAIDFMLKRLFEHPAFFYDAFYNSALAAFIALVPVSTLTEETVNLAVQIARNEKNYTTEETEKFVQNKIARIKQHTAFNRNKERRCNSNLYL